MGCKRQRTRTGKARTCILHRGGAFVANRALFRNKMRNSDLAHGKQLWLISEGVSEGDNPSCAVTPGAHPSLATSLNSGNAHDTERLKLGQGANALQVHGSR